LRILSVSTYYHPYISGLTTYAKRLAEGLAARGHEIRVVCDRHDPELPLRETLGGVSVERVPPAIRLSRGFIAPRIFRRLRESLRWADAAIVHTPLIEGPWFGRAARATHVPFAFIHHCDIVLPAGALNKLIEIVTWRTLHATARLASAAVGPSSDYAHHSALLSRYPDKLALIYPPVVISDPDPDQARAYRAKALSAGPFLGFAGRFVLEKRPDVLLCAALQPRNRAEWKNCRILFAGQPHVHYEDYYSTCADLIEELGDGCVFLGLLTNPTKLASFYRACDVFVLPSDRESFALVQVEAMMCGTPVVASDIAGSRVPIQATGMGELFRPGISDDLAEKIEKVFLNRAAYLRPGKEIAARFSCERTLDEFERLLLNLTT